SALQWARQKKTPGERSPSRPAPSCGLLRDLLQLGLQRLGGAETNGLGGLDVDDLTRLRVAALARLAVTDHEGAEARIGEALLLLDRAGNAVEHRVDELGRQLLGQLVMPLA